MNAEALEYARVLSRSRDPELLRRLHARAISPTDAEALVALVFETAHRTAPRVVFRGYRGHSNIKTMTITLPAAGNRIAPSSGIGIGSLRVGIVLHECAHLLAQRFTTRDLCHGPVFVGHLDALCAAYGELFL
jgi:hypothetical protein